MPSGPIFVLDGHAEQPLMPLAPAHARKLLASGKARSWPHPTFTILQLTRAVMQPILRPVLIGIAVHRRIVELFVVAEGVRKTLPLLYVVVDVSAQRRHWQWQRCKRRRRRAGGRAVRLMLDIGATIGALWRFLPLSHIVVLVTDTLRRDYPGLARQLKQYMSSEELHASITPRNAAGPAGVPPALYEALRAFRRQPTAHAPLIVAMPMDPIDPQTQLMDAKHAELVDIPGIGATDGLIGILDLALDDTDDLPLNLSLPIAVDAGGVKWITVRINSSKHLQSWPANIVAFLPLASLEGRPDADILEHTTSY